MNKTSQYVIQDKTIIFNPEYNKLFDAKILEMLSNSDTIIFDNYQNGENVKNKYNQPIKKIPTELKIVNIQKSNKNYKIISESILQINPNIQIIRFLI